MAAQVQKIDNNKHIGTSAKSKYVVEILRDLCIGAASCVAIGANTFVLDEENKVLILEGEWDDDEILLAAAQSCPVFAIIVKDAATGKQIFPQQEDSVAQASSQPQTANASQPANTQDSLQPRATTIIPEPAAQAVANPVPEATGNHNQPAVPETQVK